MKGYENQNYYKTLLNFFNYWSSHPNCIRNWLPGSLIRWWEKYGTFICTRFLEHIIIFDPNKKITDVVMLDGYFNVQLGSELLKTHFSKISVMRGVECTVSLFFNDVSKISIMNQMITDHREIYNIFGSGIYHKPHSIFKSKFYEFHNRNIGLFIGNDTMTAGYFIGMNRYTSMRKALLATVSSSEFNIMVLK